MTAAMVPRIQTVNRAAVVAVPCRAAPLVRDCASGRELAAIGFGDDVAIAIELKSSRAVPVLVDGCFVDAS